MLTSKIEFLDTSFANDMQQSPSMQYFDTVKLNISNNQRMLVLSEDALERQQLIAWSQALGVEIDIATSGTELLGNLAPPIDKNHLLAMDVVKPVDLIVLGGQLPSWVYSDLIDRTKLRAQRPGLGSATFPTPAILLLLDPHLIDTVFEHISIHHPDLLVDFVERPVRAVEFCVRAKRLLQLVVAPNNAHGVRTANDVESDVTRVSDNTKDTSALNALNHQSAEFGPYRFDFKRHSVDLHDEKIRLSYREFALAWMLFSKMGSMVPRAELLQRLFMRSGPETSGKHSRSLDSYICRVRHDLKMVPSNGYTLEAVYGQGYVVRPV